MEIKIGFTDGTDETVTDDSVVDTSVDDGVLVAKDSHGEVVFRRDNVASLATSGGGASSSSSSSSS